MSSPVKGWSSTPQSSVGLRIGVALAVVTAHVGAIGAILLAPEESPPLMMEPEAVMVSVIEAPLLEQAKAQLAVPTPPQPVQDVPPEPEPEVLPDPDPEPEITPEPEPIVEKASEPAPKPKPKPKPPAAKPQPDIPPDPKPEPPVEQVPPSGTPDGTQTPQGPRGPVSDQPVMVSSVEYLGGQPKVIYPPLSQRMREEGKVMVLIDINTQGLVDKASIAASSGYARLDEAALTAARKARFKPLTRNGVAFPARAKIPFDFTLRK